MHTLIVEQEIVENLPAEVVNSSVYMDQLVKLVQLSVVDKPTCDELSEKLQAGVQKILGDLFLHGSLTGLQVAGSSEEYFVRVVVTLPSHHVPRPVIICAKEVQPSEDNQEADKQGADSH